MKLVLRQFGSCCCRGGAGRSPSGNRRPRQSWHTDFAVNVGARLGYPLGPAWDREDYSIGQQVARCIDDPGERVLVASTTNKASDGVALEIGKASRSLGRSSWSERKVLRVGNGVNLRAFREQGLDDLARGTETGLLLQVAELKAELVKSTSPDPSNWPRSAA